MPPSGVKKNQTSVALAVFVNCCVPSANFTLAGHILVRSGVASFVNIKVNELPVLAVPLGFEKVNVQSSVRVAVKIVAAAKLIVVAAPVFPIATTSSENLPRIKPTDVISELALTLTLFTAALALTLTPVI